MAMNCLYFLLFIYLPFLALLCSFSFCMCTKSKSHPKIPTEVSTAIYLLLVSIYIAILVESVWMSTMLFVLLSESLNVHM